MHLGLFERSSGLNGLDARTSARVGDRQLRDAEEEELWTSINWVFGP
jgi:hypothetical protein